MAIRLTHIVTARTGDQDVHQLRALLHGLPADRVRQGVIAVGPTPSALDIPPGVPLARAYRRATGPISLFWTTGLEEALDEQRPQVVCAWGVEVWNVATSAAHSHGCRVALFVSDPAELPGVRSEPDAGAVVPDAYCVVCGTPRLREQVIDAGWPAEFVVAVPHVIDPEVWRRDESSVLRSELELPADVFVLVTPSPPTRQGGQYFAAWATAILAQVRSDVCLIVPGVSREQRRIVRLAESSPCPRVYRFPEARYTPRQLLAGCDLLVVPAVADAATGWVHWAMAMSVPVVASSLPETGQWVKEGKTGYLCQPGQPQRLASAIRRALDDDSGRRQFARRARERVSALLDLSAGLTPYLDLFERLAGDGSGVSLANRR